MEIIRYGEDQEQSHAGGRRFVFGLSRKEATKIVQQLVGQLGEGCTSGSSEFIATSRDNPELNARYAFIIAKGDHD